MDDGTDDKKSDDKKSDDEKCDCVKCFKCMGKCCKSVAIEIDTPEDLDDFEDLKWYIYHPGLTVYVGGKGDWNVNMSIGCIHLTKEGKCMIYENRPPVCRDYGVDDCNNCDDKEIVFNTAEDVDAYIAKLRAEGTLKPGKIFK